MSTILQFPIHHLDGVTVADVLTQEVIKSSVSAAVATHGIDDFAMAFTAFGEQDSAIEKIAA